MSAVIKQFPGAAVERPPEPDWRSIYTDDDDLAIASAAWKDVVTEMSAAGTLTVGNGQYERASRQVAETGAVTKAKRTKVPQYSPYWIVMRQSDDSIRVAEAELGITPLRRSKAGKVNRVQKAPRAADKFLG
jgi:phage terminase small subunit